MSNRTSPTTQTAPSANIQRWLQRCVLRVTACLCAVGGDQILEEYRFLDGYLAPIMAAYPDITDLGDLERELQRELERSHLAEVKQSPANQSQNLPLARLQQTGLTAAHIQALILASLVEVDARFGSVYSVLHPLPEEQRLTIGLLEDLMRFNAPANLPPAWVLIKDLEQQGLITRHNSEADPSQQRPRASQALTLPSPIWDAICGHTHSRPAIPVPITDQLTYHAPHTLGSFNSLQGLLPQPLLDKLTRLPDLVHRDLTQGVILRGMRGTGRLQAISALAHQQECGILHINRPDPKRLPHLCQLAGALATLQQAIPVIDLELAPGENLSLPPLANYTGLFGILLNREGSLSGAQAARCITLQVPAPTQPARHQQWAQVLTPPHGVALNGTRQVINEASKRYHLTLGTVKQAGRLAHAYAALNDHAHVELADVQEACQSLNQQTLENMATRVAADRGWESLIVSDRTRAELEILISRCRHRETLLSHLGPGFTGTSRGIRALFGGCSGTGKTLAARIIANALGLDLYRVELAAVVSKYIGETERNLSRLFARAEEQDIVLLLDEGDSLLTSRTDVSSANDRYANMETNYLLQRLEQYEGIILITSNATNRIDSAFQRRIDVVVDFALPDPGQRQRLWELHLPSNHTVSTSALRQAALRCQLSGGQIRNATLHASLLALEADTPMCDTFLSAGIHREYTKMGAASPLE